MTPSDSGTPKIRLSQTISPFGVGAIYDYLGESFVAMDAMLWGVNGTRLQAERLSRLLGGVELRRAPTTDDRQGSLPFMRFPQWLFCPNQDCRRMYHITDSKTAQHPVCKNKDCRDSKNRPTRLVPMRFIAVCPDGHMSDVPWGEWAHSRADQPRQKQCAMHKLPSTQQLVFRQTSTGTGGLESLEVRCLTCDAHRSLEGLTRKDALKHALRSAGECRGGQPWEAVKACSEELQVVHRGASNVHFTKTVSALEIPPDSRNDEHKHRINQIRANTYFAKLASGPGLPADKRDQLVEWVCEEMDCVERDVVEALRLEKPGVVVPDFTADDGVELADAIKSQEWTAFQVEEPELPGVGKWRQTFVTRREVLVPGDLASPPFELLDGLVDSVMAVPRLREIRALTGFSRLDWQGKTVPSYMGRPVGFYPAVEVLGEGIFLSLGGPTDELRNWETDDVVLKRVEMLAHSYKNARFLGQRLPEPTPRLVLLHSLAHLLIRQLSFTCGYATASLRERIYYGEDLEGGRQAGILIYTAAGDSEGTLGGLSRQAKPPFFAETMLRSLEQAIWCSADPVCSESRGQGFESLNLAACHACSLLPETSCEFGNALLDRGLLVGASGFDRGYFQEVVSTLVCAREGG